MPTMTDDALIALAVIIAGECARARGIRSMARDIEGARSGVKEGPLFYAMDVGALYESHARSIDDRLCQLCANMRELCRASQD